jgi:predicted transcriptional regulator
MRRDLLMSARVTVTLSEEVLARLDEIAESDGVSRSDVVREASARYVSHRSADAAMRARAAAVEEGLEWLENIARKSEDSERTSLDVLREVRGSDVEAWGRPLDPAYDDPGIP